MKKVLIVFNNLKIGGIENKIVDICNYYSKDKHIKVTLILKEKDGVFLERIQKNINIISPKITKKFKIRTILFPVFLAKKFTTEKANLIISFGNYSSICATVGKLFSRSNTPIIISEDSSVIEQIEQEKYSLMRTFLVKNLYPYADKIIVLTKIGKEKLNSINPNIKNKITIKENWLPKKYENKKNKITKDIDILFMGRFEKQKNPIKFVEIIKLISKENPKIKSIMVGDGSLKDNVINKINEYKLGKNIIIKDGTMHPEKYFFKSKVLLLTSIHEGFPLTMLEANFSKCVPICSEVKEVFKYFYKYNKYIFYKTEIDASKKILHVLSNNPLRNKISKYYQEKTTKEQSINFKSTIMEFNKYL